MDVPITGLCEPGFEPVRAAFAANFAERGEVGAAVCVQVHGTTVVDLVGCWADEAHTRPWAHDTIVNFYSVGKAIVAPVVGLMRRTLPAWTAMLAGTMLPPSGSTSLPVKVGSIGLVIAAICVALPWMNG